MKIITNFIATLRRYRVSSMLNILSLAVAFASLYVIMVQVNYDLTFNHSIKDYEKLYLVTYTDDNGENPDIYFSRRYMEDIASASPLMQEITSPAGYPFDSKVVVDKGDKKYSIEAITSSADAAFFKLFDYTIVSGSIDDYSLSEDGVRAAVSESFAKANNIEINDEIKVYHGNEFKGQEVKPTTVVLIYKDRTPNSSFSQMDILTNQGIDAFKQFYICSNTYVVKSDLSQNELTSRVNRDIDAQLNVLYPDSAARADVYLPTNLSFIPLADIYFNQEIDAEYFSQKDKFLTYLLFIIAVLIVVVAIVNFVNFFFALVPVRIKAINTYKIFGSSNLSLRFNFMCETIFLVVLSLVISFPIIFIVNDIGIINFMTASLDFEYNVDVIAMIFGVALLLAILISLYPAYYIVKFSPAFTLRGGFISSAQGKRLRYVLITTQLIIASTMICSTVFIYRQFDFMNSKEIGMNTENMLSVSLPTAITYSDKLYSEYEHSIISNAQVVDITSSTREILGSSFNSTTVSKDGDEKGENIGTLEVAYNFLDFFDINIVQGRDFQENEHSLDGDYTYVFNESAAKKFDIDLDKGCGVTLNVVGVAENVNYEPLRSAIVPLGYCLVKDSKERYTKSFRMVTHIRVKEGSDIDALKKYIYDTVEQLTDSFSASKTEMNTFSELKTKIYDRELSLMGLVGIFTIVSILISLMGIVGLVYLEAQHRRKEIAIRRVYGATVTEILMMLNRKFMLLVTLCFVASVPLCYYFVDRWLSSFAYRTTMLWWIFLLVFIFIVALIVTVVSLCTLNSARQNPAELISKNS